MTNRKGIPAHQDLFHQQAHDFLPLGHLQRIRPQPQPGREIGERFDQPQAVSLVGRGRVQRLQFSLNRLLLLAEVRHPTAKLLQACQTFLIGVQQAIHALLQPGMFPVQQFLSLFQRIGFLGRFQPALQFLLNHARIFQQPQELLPDYGIEVVLTNR
jgi:hypothetical protein